MPLAFGIVSRGGAANVSKNGRGHTVVTHRELVDNVVIVGTTANWRTLQYPLNPARSSTFPWLATIAAAYEQYRFKVLRFHWVPAVAATVSGQVISYFDFDSRDAVAASRGQALAHQTSTMWSVFEETRLPTRTEMLSRVRYCQPEATQPSGTDIREYNVGTLNLCWTEPIVGNAGTALPAGTMLGSVFVEYVVEFIEPQLQTTTSSGSFVITGRSTPQALNRQLVINLLGQKLVSSGDMTGTQEILKLAEMIQGAAATGNTLKGLPNTAGTMKFLQDWTGVVSMNSWVGAKNGDPSTTLVGNCETQVDSATTTCAWGANCLPPLALALANATDFPTIAHSGLFPNGLKPLWATIFTGSNSDWNWTLASTVQLPVDAHHDDVLRFADQMLEVPSATGSEIGYVTQVLFTPYTVEEQQAAFYSGAMCLAGPPRLLALADSGMLPSRVFTGKSRTSETEPLSAKLSPLDGSSQGAAARSSATVDELARVLGPLELGKSSPTAVCRVLTEALRQCCGRPGTEALTQRLRAALTTETDRLLATVKV